ncbi:uncharacterized protein LOC142591420 [Dermacentor variabilis]|uniref:uncharacterized protein LOC142591420 n=1 Tax=Dermacentor variabilis TaxID=34621 RepID=UPI003F5B29EC
MFHCAPAKPTLRARRRSSFPSVPSTLQPADRRACVSTIGSRIQIRCSTILSQDFGEVIGSRSHCHLDSSMTGCSAPKCTGRTETWLRFLRGALWTDRRACAGEWYVYCVWAETSRLRKGTRICENTLAELMTPASIFATASGQVATNEYHSAKEKNGLSYISEACLRYAWNPEEGVEDILAFLSHIKLDLRNITEDTTEDPLERMIELSFEHGLDVLVSFSLDYNVTGDIYHAFVVQINASSELEEFFSSLGCLNEEAVDDFYQLLLRRYALVEDSEILQHLQEADADISDILNATTESGTQAKKSIADLARATGVTTDRWNVLLASCCPNQSTCNEYVVTNERALALVAYVARAGQALRMRRLLAWHVLRHLVGPKADILAALNHTGLGSDLQEDYDIATNPESKCYWLLEKLDGIRYTAIDLFEGMDAVSTHTIASVASLMVQFQNAAASVFNSPQKNENGGATKNVTQRREVVIPGGNTRQLLDAEPAHPFTAFTAIEKVFAFFSVRC